MPTYGKESDDGNESESESESGHEDDADIEVYLEHLKELEEVQVLIDRLDFEDPFTAEEFVQYDKAETTTEMISDEEILKAILPNNNQKKETEEEPVPMISHTDAIESYDKVILYLEQQEDNFDTKKEELKFIKKLRKEALKQRFISKRQMNLDSFINVIE